MKNMIKKIGIIFGSLLVIGCATTKSAETSSSSSSPKKIEKKGAQVIDWQGSEFGKDIPEWVEYVSENDYARLSQLPEMEDKIPFAVTGTGQDRDLLKIWVNTNDAQAELSKLIKTNVTTSAHAALSGNKDAPGVKKLTESITTIFSNTQFSGFSKARDFWTKVQIPEGGTEYRYYILYSIEKENLSYQIDVALGKIAAENAEEQELLDKVKEQSKITAMTALGTTQPVR